jgi:hypothetical protein
VILVLTFFPFSGFRMESRLHYFLASVFNKKEHLKFPPLLLPFQPEPQDPGSRLLGLSGLADREVEIIEGDLGRSMGELPDLPERPQESRIPHQTLESKGPQARNR